MRRKVFGFTDNFKTFAEAKDYLLARLSERNEKARTNKGESPGGKA